MTACGADSTEDRPSDINALQVSPTSGVGLQADYYTTPPRSSVTGINFAAMIPTFSETVADIQKDVGNGPLWPGGASSNVVIRYGGRFLAPSSGLYSFYLNSDDGSALFINGQRVLLNDGLRPARELEVSVDLSRGEHQIEVRYFERSGLAVIELDWSGPHTPDRQTAFFGPAASTGLRAEYFTGPEGSSLAEINFLKPPSKVETVFFIDKAAGFNSSFWVGGPNDFFAARYRGFFSVDVAGTHTFHVSSDDGAALYINGQLVVNNDGIHGKRVRQGSVSLPVGDHEIELRYFEWGGRADLRLDWTRPGAGRELMRFGPSEGLLARYSTLPQSGPLAGLADVNFQAQPTATERVRDINKNVGPQGSFWPGGPTDRFAVRYTGSFYVRNGGTYRFYLTSDDGSALYIDGTPILQNDGIHAAQTLEVPVELYAGVHEIEVRYFEAEGGAVLRLEWQGLGTNGRELMRFKAPPRPGLVAEYFLSGGVSRLDDIDFASTPSHVDRVETLQFPFSNGPIWTGGPSDNFAARFSGGVEVQNGGDYTFFLESDNAAVLYLDGERLIDRQGSDTATSESSFTLQVQAGLHDLEVRYLEGTGPSSLRLDWEGPSTTGREPVYFGPQKRGPLGFRADYYVNTSLIGDLDQVNFDGKPDAIAFLDFLDFSTALGFWPGGPSDDFAARFKGTINIEGAGNYTFFLRSDDGSELWVDGNPIIDNDGRHAVREQSATVPLNPGEHVVEVRYFEARGGAELTLEWIGPDSPVRSILDLVGTGASASGRRPEDVVSNFSLPEDAPSVPLALPQFDAEGDPLTVQQILGPDTGSARLRDGVVLYTPAPGLQGKDAFRYRATDASGGETTGYVEIDVQPSFAQTVSTVRPGIAPELKPSGRFLLLRPVASVPNSRNGSPARMNAVVAHNGHLYISDEGREAGESRIFELTPTQNGNYSTRLWFDVGAAVFAATGRNINNANPVHGGARSLAFHPAFSSNGKIYVAAMEDRPANPTASDYISDAAQPIGADSVLIEWTVVGGVVDPSSYREVFRVGMPVFDHTIRQIAFNQYAVPGDPDYGLLYITHGDGSVQSATAGGGQNYDALGKILRIDPLESGAQAYRVPPSNPFVGNAAMLDEVYATGFRNPHNLSFNQIPGGGVALINTDVGRNNFEEVNIVEPGANYGWSEREGPMVHLQDGGGRVLGIGPLPPNEASFGFTYPAMFAAHEGAPGGGFSGKAFAGAFVIDNGSELDGEFIFGNFSRPGRIFHASLSALLAADTRVSANEDPNSALTWATPQELILLVDTDRDAGTIPIVFSSFTVAIDRDRGDLRFGRGLNGELVIVNKQNGTVYVAVNTLPRAHPQFQGTDRFR